MLSRHWNQGLILTLAAKSIWLDSHLGCFRLKKKDRQKYGLAWIWLGANQVLGWKRIASSRVTCWKIVCSWRLKRVKEICMRVALWYLMRLQHLRLRLMQLLQLLRSHLTRATLSTFPFSLRRWRLKSRCQTSQLTQRACQAKWTRSPSKRSNRTSQDQQLSQSNRPWYSPVTWDSPC